MTGRRPRSGKSSLCSCVTGRWTVLWRRCTNGAGRGRTTRKGQPHAGRRFDRAALVRLLTNVLYLGEVRHKGKIYGGEQAAILDRETWQQAQGLLRQRQRGDRVRNRTGALLQELLGCGVCGSRMVPGYSTKKKRRYGYYVCRKAQQQGAAACPGQSIPAARIEGAIIAGLQGMAEAAERQPLREACRVGVRWSGPYNGAGWRAWWNGLTMTGAAGRRGCAGERPSRTVSHSLFCCGIMRRRSSLRRRSRRNRGPGRSRAGCPG